MGKQRAAARLKAVLRANAGFSATSGLLLVVAGVPVAEFLGGTMASAPTWVLPVLGAGLVLFALLPAGVSRGQPISRVGTLVVSALDGVWVFASLLLALLWPGLFGRSGWIAFAMVGVCVALFGAVQLWGSADGASRRPGQQPPGREICDPER